MRTAVQFPASYAMLEVHLEPGEAVRAEPGAMIAQQGVQLTTGTTGGGVIRGLRRMLGGESFVVNTFAAGGSGGEVYLASATPGDIGSFDLVPGNNLFLQGGAFLACTDGVKLDSKFQGFRGLFSGESLFFLRAYCAAGQGTVFYNAYGAVYELEVIPGQELVVDTGHLVAFSDDVEYSVGKVGGLRSMLLGGEGLVMKFRGQGRVWVQTRDLMSLAEKLIPFLPSGVSG